MSGNKLILYYKKFSDDEVLDVLKICKWFMACHGVSRSRFYASKHQGTPLTSKEANSLVEFAVADACRLITTRSFEKHKLTTLVVKYCTKHIFIATVHGMKRRSFRYSLKELNHTSLPREIEDNNPIDTSETIDSRQLVQSALTVLSQKYRYILTSRYGAFGMEYKTLETLASEFSVSRQRIHQIVQKAIKKMQTHCH